jgi:hypothetical protein
VLLLIIYEYDIIAPQNHKTIPYVYYHIQIDGHSVELAPKIVIELKPFQCFYRYCKYKT